MHKTYKELITLPSFEERFEYLKLQGSVGASTFGRDRFMNQLFYTSALWKSTRNKVIIRDEGCDLGIADRDIYDMIVVHHINPITITDIENNNPCLYDLNNLITTTNNTHNAIHYGNIDTLIRLPAERRPGDTIPWL